MDMSSHLSACPQCDTLHQMAELPDGARARCTRCHTVLVTNRSDAISKILALAIAATVLMIAALFFPFLSIRVGASINKTSLFDAVLAFSGDHLLPAALFVAALIIILPLTRVIALTYALLPLARGRPPYRRAKSAFHLAETLKPWSMVEIFIVGVAVSMIKVAGLATVTLGPAFWALSILVVVTTLKDRLICNWTIWAALERT